MALWIILGIITILVLCLLLVRIGIGIEYSDKGLKAVVHIGFIRLRLYPSRGKDKGKQRKKKPKKRTDKGVAESEKKGGRIAQFRELISIIYEISSKLNKRFTIDKLTLYYMAAGEDAAKAAMNFGTASLISGLVLPILDNAFTVKEKDIRTAVSFNDSESYVYFKTKLSIAIRVIPYIAVFIAKRYRHIYKEKGRQQKAKPSK